jgi:hypothetical protein
MMEKTSVARAAFDDKNQSCLIQDEPEAEAGFSYKMSLKERSRMLKIDRQGAGSREVELGADPGVFGGQRGSRV